MCRLCCFVLPIIVRFVLICFLLYFRFVQRKKHFFFVGFLFHFYIFRFKLYFCKFVILLIISDYFCKYICSVLNQSIMSKVHLHHYNYLQIIYKDGSFDISKDESLKIWQRFHSLLENFSVAKFEGVQSVSVLDNAKRKVVSLNLYCYGCKE